MYRKPLVMTLFCVLVLGVAGCSSSETSVSTVTNSIVGTWQYTYIGSGCVESYTFNNGNTWSESSLDEIQTGTYVFEETVNVGNRHALTVVVTSDNGLSDCDGFSEDSTGVSGTIYVNFPSSLVMEWYDAETGGAVEATLTKQ